MASTPSELAAAFHALHHRDRVLVLPNAWDAGSARLAESCGAEAIATTSAGVAWSNGYPDGQAIPFTRVVEAIAAITRVVKIPVSADIEAGSSTDPEAVREHVAAVIGTGAVGINLEDGRESPDLTVRKIAAARSAAERAGVPLYINARTDTYLKKLVPPEEAVAETLARAKRYRDAGASGIFVPLLKAPDEIRTVAGAVGLPLNVLAAPGLPPVEELGRLGVRRVSAGGGIARAAFVAAREAASSLLRTGRYDALFAGTLDLNALLSGR
jgi:2-methylisocitrate lyase-like PEP mutase family enzyme